MLLLATSAGAAPSLDAARLAKLETNLSIPICGVGYLDSRAGQLDAAGKFDKVPYLLHMARTRYADDKRRSLSVLAVRLLSRKKARSALVSLVKDKSVAAEVRYEAARTLAQELGSGFGKKLLFAEAHGGDLQRRADSLSALMHVLAAGDLERVIDLAADQDHYVVDRFLEEIEKQPRLRPSALALLRKKYTAAKGTERVRYGYALLLLGVPGHESEVKRFLLDKKTVKDETELYQLGQMCHALAARGHAFAFDAALHVTDLYRQVKGAAFFMYALSVFWESAPFDQKWVLGKTEPEAARIVRRWWQQNGAALRFDGKRFR